MQVLVKLVQAAIFIAVIVFMANSDHPDATHGGASVMVAVMVAFVFTVVPWLIFMMLKEAIADFRRWRSKPARVNAVVPELLNDRRSSRRIALNSRPRIGK
jgi:cytochrome b